MAEHGELYALLIGINEYASKTLRPLKYAVADVLAFRELLRDRMGLADARSRVLTLPLSGSGYMPSRADVLSALGQFSLAPMGADDTFVFYFAGHGFAAGEASYLLTVDSRTEGEQVLKDTAIDLGGLSKYVASIGAGKQLLILDACRNESVTGGRAPGGGAMAEAMARDIAAIARPAARAAGTRKVWAALSACWKGQMSYEYPAARHGWFCHHFLETLREHPGGEVDVMELRGVVARRMKERA